MALEYAVDVGEAKGYPLPLRSQRSPSQEQGGRRALTAAGHASAHVVLSEEPLELDWGPTVLALLDDVARGATVATMAARFHAGLADGIAAMAHETGAQRVALSGGCFQNRVLVERSVQRLRAAGHEILLHRHVPANDGGICLGQVAVAAAHLEGARG
jgi:hydrogenase maturation protein HypF